MRKSDLKKLQSALAHIDRAYDRIGEALGGLEKQGRLEAVNELEDVQRELSNQQYYINQVIKVEQ